jgi:outer membrane biosynthesis protein TonB
MVTPRLAGFPLQAQSTGLSNNIPKRIATSQKGMIVLPTQNEGLTDSMILKESLNTLTAEKVKHYESNNTENIGFDKKIKKTKKNKTRANKKKQTRKPKPRKKQKKTTRRQEKQNNKKTKKTTEKNAVFFLFFS